MLLVKTCMKYQQKICTNTVIFLITLHNFNCKTQIEDKKKQNTIVVTDQKRL